MNAAQRALIRCQQTVAREGLSYSNQLQWRIARCIRPIAECTTFGGDPSSCRESSFACTTVGADLTGLQDHLYRSVSNSCGGVSMDRLMSAGFAQQMGDCAPTSIDAFAHCFAANLRRELGDVLGQILPSACDLLARSGVTVPAEVCAGPPMCQPPTTTTTTSTTTTTTIPLAGSLYCGGADGVVCPDGFVCDRTDPLCTQSAMPGACVPTPPATCDVGSPVCGCDGTTYASDCDRLKAGIVKARGGACDAPPSACDAANPTCPQGQFCDFTPGDCGEGGVGGLPADDRLALRPVHGVRHRRGVRLRPPYLHVGLQPARGRCPQGVRRALPVDAKAQPGRRRRDFGPEP